MSIKSAAVLPVCLQDQEDVLTKLREWWSISNQTHSVSRGGVPPAPARLLPILLQWRALGHDIVAQSLPVLRAWPAVYHTGDAE